MSAEVQELWTNDFVNNESKPIRDEVFSGDKFLLNTGITHNSLSAPIADNVDQVVVNADNTPYIEVNTAEENNIGYYTPKSELRIIDGIEYIVFPLVRPER